MSRLVVSTFSISIDGYGAGPRQDVDNPVGVGGTELFDWFFHTKTWRDMHALDGGETGLDDDVAARGFVDIGAWILGRNMFGPVRGPWLDADWRGWWGDEPPYHVPVFVLTHHPRPSLPMAGGTTFHFVTGGIEEALELARRSAQGKDVRLGGGVATIRQYLQAGLIDELRVSISPVLLGSGEHLLRDIDTRALGYQCVAHSPGKRAAAHVVLRKQA